MGEPLQHSPAPLRDRQHQPERLRSRTLRYARGSGITEPTPCPRSRAKAQLASRRALAEFDQAETARRAIADSRRLELARSGDDARQHGDEARILLEGSGTLLVHAVSDALEDLGFAVIDGDELPEHKGAKREDLRVNDGEWTCLVEVKGYASAAKSSDIIQATSVVPSYVRTQGKAPDAIWYVVNAYKDTDPDERPRALEAREDDVSAFGDSHHGCVIDTRDLFRLWQSVRLDQVSKEQARALLQSAKGRFTFAGH